MRVLLVRPLLLNMLTFIGAIDCEPLELEYLASACRTAGAGCSRRRRRSCSGR